MIPNQSSTTPIIHPISTSSSSNHLNQSDRHHPPKSTNIKNTNPSSSLPHDIFSITDEELAAQYTFETEIGYGNWGSIWRISTNPSLNDQHQTSLKKTLAIKLVHRDKTSNTTHARVKSLWGEFKTLRRFKSNPSPNVLRISSFIITPSYALLTMAFHPNLLPVRLTESNPKTLHYLRGLLSGIDFLHRHHITHNDIKPANVVISDQDQPVFIDFGFAVSYGSDWEGEVKGEKKYWSQLSWGTPEYLSPQRAKGEPHDERLSDIWSLGITMYEVVVGRTPFESDDHEEFLTKEALEVYYERTLSGEFLGVHHLSKPLKDLLKSMVQPDPKKRLTSCANGILHPFFESHISPPHSRRSVIGSTIQDRLKTFETKKGVTTPINKPIPQLATNNKIKLETTTSSIKVFRDQPELNTKTPVKKNSLPPRVLTPQCSNTPPVSNTTTKRVPVPYSKLHLLHQQQQENLKTERTPTLANGRHYVTKTPAVVKPIMNPEAETDLKVIHLDKEENQEGEVRFKKLNEMTRAKMMKDEVEEEQEEEVYPPLKSTTGFKNESRKKKCLSKEPFDHESILTPKDREFDQRIGSNTTSTPNAIPRMKSPRKQIVHKRPIDLRPKTAGPNIKLQTEISLRYRPRSVIGSNRMEKNETKVESRKLLFKEHDRMEIKDDDDPKKSLGLNESQQVEETEKKAEEITNHSNLKSSSDTIMKNTTIDQLVKKNKMSLSFSANRFEMKSKEEVQSKIPMKVQSRIRTSSVKVTSSQASISTLDPNSQRNLTSQISLNRSLDPASRRRTSSSVLIRNPNTPGKSPSPLRKERLNNVITTSISPTNRIRTTSVRVSSRTGKGLGSLERSQKSSMKVMNSKKNVSNSPNLRIKRLEIKHEMKSTLSTCLNKIEPNQTLSNSNPITQINHSNPSTLHSRITHSNSKIGLTSRSRSCLIGPSSLIK